MNHELNFWVVGGDRRQAELARLLARDGHTVHTLALDASDPLLIPMESPDRIERADCIVLPIPVSANGILHAPLAVQTIPLVQILDRLQPQQFLCGGRVDAASAGLARTRGLVIHDYFARDELAVANAVPTAEGAIQLAMEHLPITIHGAHVLVIGFGRVGRAAAQRFGALGAKVRAAARKCGQLALAESMGFGAEELGALAGWLCSYDLVVNTVPAPVLGQAELADLKRGCLVIDLASEPGGVDMAAAEALGVKVIHALALPGRVAPVTAGAAIQSTVYNMLRELG